MKNRLAALSAFLARKDVRWNFFIVPAFVGGLLILLRAWGELPDVQAQVYSVAAHSVALLIAIALTHAITKALGWNLPNAYREHLMRVTEGLPWGAFAVLVLEAASILGTLALLLLAITAWAS